MGCPHGGKDRLDKEIHFAKSDISRKSLFATDVDAMFLNGLEKD